MAYSTIQKKHCKCSPDCDKWVKLFNGEYELSNLGEIKYFTPNGNPKIGNPTLQNNGYYAHSFTVNGKVIVKTLHRLLAIHFIPNPYNYPCINHKNGVKTDNRLSNLEWCSYKQNNLHAFETGLRVMPHGEDSGFSKLTNKQALEIFNSKESGVKLAKMYGVGVHCISCIKTGERWSKITGKKFIKKEKHWIEFDGKKMILQDWAKVFKVTHPTLIEHLRSKPFSQIFNYYNSKHNGLQFD